MLLRVRILFLAVLIALGLLLTIGAGAAWAPLMCC
jgi:hypothetical protein